MNQDVIFALFLTLFAGLSTGIGCVMSLFAKRTNTKFLSLSLGFSAGVMLYVAMIEIFKKSQFYLTQSYGEIKGNYFTVAAFFACFSASFIYFISIRNMPPPIGKSAYRVR